MATTHRRILGRQLILVVLLAGFAMPAPQGCAQESPAALATTAGSRSVVLAVSGTVEYSKAGGTNWVRIAADQRLSVGDRVRTGEKSRATIRLQDLTVIRVNERTTLELRKPAQSSNSPGLEIKSGGAYFFGRGKPGQINLQTPMATAAIRGTEFDVQVAEDGRTVVTLFEGEMDLANDQGSVSLKAGEQAVAQTGTAPAKAPVLEAINVIQWALYYPGVLDVAELDLKTEGNPALAGSFQAYEEGDLLQAIAAYPFNRPPATDSERLYSAALLLGAGLIEQAEATLASITATNGKPVVLRESLRRIIASVKGKEFPPATTGKDGDASATAWLSQSYYLQSRLELDNARSAALKATQVSPRFGFAWERLGELEFSFGKINAAKAALEQALALAPKNAQAQALQGFLLAAENRIAPARAAFEKAIALDSNLGNAWLGRGLCRIRTGDVEGGREDLQVAATLEPTRSVLRSYLGKAFQARHEAANARRELGQARRLDPADPTTWLYSALLDYDEHQVNRAVEDLEQAQNLNNNRRLYRSQLLLDGDRAVRSANLANLYLAAGMPEVSVQEAARAVSYDYGNYSAHRFLADSFNGLRDPTRFNLRYETVWFNETLLSDLLAPVGAGSLSQNISQYEYSKLFEADRLGLNTSSQARSDGEFLQSASQFGTFGNTSYSLDLDYQLNHGVRPNNELSRIEWYTKVKQQITPQDSLFLLTKYEDYHSGDNFQYYNPASARPHFSFDEFQSPHVVGAYHHEWTPGIHTLLLVGGLNNEQRFGDTAVPLPLVEHNALGQVSRVLTPAFDLGYGSKFSFYTTEFNQIFQTPKDTLVAGFRYQIGDFENRNRLDVSPGSPFALLFLHPAVDTSVRQDFERVAGYGYLTHELFDGLYLTAGITYDWLRSPLNLRLPPLVASEKQQNQIGPKAALVWMPNETVSVRGMYSRFLGGVSFDESYRLEPSQLAGFGQAYRSLISESIVGSVSGPTYEVAGAGVDFKFKTRTYAGLQVEWLTSSVDNPVGAFQMPLPIQPITLQRTLNYEERVLSAYVHQLLGKEWSVGGSYTLRNSELHTLFPEVPTSVTTSADTTQSATMHQIAGNLLFNHPSGFFSRLDSTWYLQSNRGYTPDLPGDTVHQLDFTVGYRLPKQLGSVSVTIMNLTDEDYHLNPLNVYTELPRKRVLMGRVRLQF